MSMPAASPKPNGALAVAGSVSGPVAHLCRHSLAAERRARPPPDHAVIHRRTEHAKRSCAYIWYTLPMRFAILVVPTAVLILLAGCSGSGSHSGATPSVSAVPTDPATTSASDSPTPSSTATSPLLTGPDVKPGEVPPTWTRTSEPTTVAGRLPSPATSSELSTGASPRRTRTSSAPSARRRVAVARSTSSNSTDSPLPENTQSLASRSRRMRP
jgi:hypothetical protein